MELLNALQWRYAVKKMSGKAVAEADVKTIVEAARMAPTSAGIQPFEVIVISNKAVSYTHLDVYKRQCLDLLDLMKILISFFIFFL